MKIFVADDDPSLKRFVERWLTSLTKHEVSFFDNGADVVEALARQSPCILVSDLDMPGLTGEEVAAVAARLPNPPRIVLMSGDHEHLKTVLFDRIWSLPGIDRTETYISLGQMDPKPFDRALIDSLEGS